MAKKKTKKAKKRLGFFGRLELMEHGFYGENGSNTDKLKEGQ
jgi:hypothetical protein